ncbi:MAG: TatD family hydrolase [Rikenellaceae bacterium]
MFTDTHTHLYSKEFNGDTEAVIGRSLAALVTRFIVPSTSSEDHDLVSCLVESHPDIMFAAYGLHPTEINDATDIAAEINIVEQRLFGGRGCAVGEVGLDMYWSQKFVDKQLAALRAQFELSVKYNLPLIIHVRDAFDLMFEELKHWKGALRGVFHGFSGTTHQYKQLMDYGDFYFGIGGVVTFKNSSLPETVGDIALDRILLETDSPYLTPVPHRGSRNESCYIPLIADKVAEIKGVPVKLLSEITEKNCNRLFNL